MNWFQKMFRPGRAKSFAIVPSTASLSLGGRVLSASPTMASCLRFIQNGILEAPMVFEEYDEAEDTWRDVEWPTELDWLRRDVLSGGITQQTQASRLQGLAADLAVYGNAILYILRDQAGNPFGTERLPWSEINPDIRSGMIASYRYSQIGGLRNLGTLAPEDVVHIRRGADPVHPCLGESLMPALREPMLADMEAARYMARMLKAPSPSLLAQDPSLDIEDAAAVSAEIARATTGERAGSVITLNREMKLERLGFSPEDMALKELVDHPQYAICSLMGIPPQALDVSASRGSSTYNNVSEASKKAARSGLAPLWETIEQSLTDQLLDTSGQRITFRTQDVRALQPDEDLKAQRAAKLYQAGVIDRAEAKRILDVDPEESDIGWYSSYDRMPAPLSSTELQSIRDQVGA